MNAGRPGAPRAEGLTHKLRRLFFFVLAGGTGFAVDAAVLSILIAWTPFGPFAARLASIAVAMLSTWVLNRTLTFGRSRHGIVGEGARYFGVGFAAAAINYLIYSAVLLAVPATPPFSALVVASAAAMGLSWLGYSRLVFQK